MNALRAEFSVEELASIQRASSESPEAYALYLEARKLYGEDGAAARIDELLRRAIDLDPLFALALGHLAERYAIGLVDTSSGNGINDVERAERERVVREYAERALELDPAVADAHAALGVLDLLHWRWSSARARFDAAAELGGLRDWSADLSAYEGRYDEAERAARRLVELSPNDWVTHRNLAQTRLRAGDLAAAGESLRRALELAPARSATHRLAAELALSRGDAAEALRETHLAEQLLGDARARFSLAQLALLYGDLGQVDDARRIVAELGAADALGSGNAAMAYLAVGNIASALDALRNAADQARCRQPGAGFLNLMVLKARAASHPVLARPEFAEALAALHGE